jgi:hypothetical protein
VNAVYNPLGCYDLRRFTSHEEMIAEAMSVFNPPKYLPTHYCQSQEPARCGPCGIGDEDEQKYVSN